VYASKEVLDEQLLRELSLSVVLAVVANETPVPRASRHFRLLPNKARCRILLRVLSNRPYSGGLLPVLLRFDRIDLLHVTAPVVPPAISAPIVQTVWEEDAYRRANFLVKHQPFTSLPIAVESQLVLLPAREAYIELASESASKPPVFLTTAAEAGSVMQSLKQMSDPGWELVVLTRKRLARKLRKLSRVQTAHSSPQLFATAQALVRPEFKMGFDRVMVESLASGLPVIVSSDWSGQLIPGTFRGAMDDLLSEFLQEKPKFPRYRRTALDYARDVFSIYRRVLSQRVGL